mmetsp:Transcript_23031/g.49845  ORF Transcript_23031/g.49845 Transcript_23031/m.49845 type:complete len:237 (+) Transcript_23031:225-935(+)
MPPKKKTGVKKKIKKAAAPVVIPIDDKLPVLSDTKVSVLSNTISMGDTGTLARLVEHYNYGSALCSTDVNGSTPLHIAVKRDDPKFVQMLADYKKIDLNAKELLCVGGLTALHHACMQGLPKIVQILLKAGASPNVRSHSAVGETPLQLCCKLGHISCAQLLLASGALDLRDNFGNNASFWASKYRQEALIKTLHLPPPRSPTAEEFLTLLLKKNPHFVLPAVKKAKSKVGKKGKK